MTAINRSILLIEDNPLDIDLTQRAFARQNIANPLHIARNCEQARQQFNTWQSNKTLPALILLDINLCGENGLELLEELRKNPLTTHTPVVVLSSSQEHHDISQAYQSGASAYLVKPINFIEFSQMIAELSSFWGQRNQLIQ
ncbi:response regulator [Atopomonas sediminilitoris]|uniref:response regulator n=1 Tax=Atopomonas sediminilitoris TaxID=2919919 RepID=UPI001F4D7762|nr:response regulator [Atopomonas sediminilitoris]MCJ8168946.1 response regulator [Atopomonas sediminilitoris]